MITTCPDCASRVDVDEALCRACGWSVPYLVRSPAASQRTTSYADRYRGTPFDSPRLAVDRERRGMGRGRAFVSVALVATYGLVGLVIFSRMGL